MGFDTGPDRAGAERVTILGLLGLGLLGCLIGIADPPAVGPHGGHAHQLLDVVRLLTATALVLGLLLGPGVAVRVLAGRGSYPGLAFLPLPGLLLMAAAGGLAWVLGGVADPRAICCAVLLPVLGMSGAIYAALGDGAVFDPEERRTLLIVGCVLGIAIGRALWSLGPAGELYVGTVSRTFQVGNRSDSRISFIISQLVAHHEAPYGPLGTHLFAPYNFSSRGPVPGLASAPVVLMTGGRPAAAYPESTWAPFDSEGFVAYRTAMMVFAATAFVSLWDLLRRIGGYRVARLGLLLAATTPFLINEVLFTWPKLMAASIMVMALICVVERRFFLAGLLASFAAMMHPVALVSVPVLALVVLWPLRGAILRRPRWGALARFVVGLALVLLFWRLVNGSHYDQNQFYEYLTQAGAELHPSIGAWVGYRLHSLADTVVPLVLPIVDAHDVGINWLGASSPAVVHFFYQYWTTIPFGFGIVFLPMLLVGLWRALRRRPWATSVLVVIPFVAFTIYWGASVTGMLREGLQFWALCLLAVLAWEQGAEHFGWLRSTPARVVLVLRPVGVVAMLLVPTIATEHEVLRSYYWPTDLIGVAAIVCFAAVLAWLVWKERPPGAAQRPAPGTRADSVPGP